MLWQFLRGLGGHYCPRGTYDDPDGDLENAPDPADLGLDPIEVAGQADLPALKGRLRCSFTRRALAIIMTVSAFMLEVQPGALDYMPQTLEKWTAHLDILRDPTKTFPEPILVDIIKPLVLGVCSYFAVTKGSGPEATARAIFNGKRFSQRCATPPATNLGDILSLLAAIARLPRKLTIVEGDVRHFFHQLKMHSEISRFFCIRQAQRFWRWSTLPMGWSWSPFIAQAISVGIIVEVLHECGEDMSMYRDLDIPPSLIEVKNKLVAAVWYDNIIMVTNDPNLALKFYQKLDRLTRSTKISMKEWNIHHPRAMEPAEKNKPSYLGLELAKFAPKRCRDSDTNTPILHWRHIQKRIETFKKCKQLLTDFQSGLIRVTPRLIAKICGSLMWDVHVGDTPLCRKEELIAIIRKAGISARETGWDKEMSLTLSELSYLQGELAVAILNDWKSFPEKEIHSDIFAATDSSDHLWGAVVWDSSNTTIRVFDSHRWPAEIAKEHIFLKELLASTLVVEALTKTHPNSHIHVLTDNTAAAAVMRRRASCSSAGNELARRIDRALEASKCMLTPIIVTSAQNPADEPSRSRPIAMSKLEYAQKVIIPQASVFCRANVQAPTAYIATNSGYRDNRHVETEDELGEVDWFRWDPEDDGVTPKTE